MENKVDLVSEDLVSLFKSAGIAPCVMFNKKTSTCVFHMTTTLVQLQEALL